MPTDNAKKPREFILSTFAMLSVNSTKDGVVGTRVFGGVRHVSICFAKGSILFLKVWVGSLTT